MSLHNLFFSPGRASSFNVFRNKARFVFCGLMALSAWASASVQYTFTSSSAFDGMPTGSFQVTVPTFISSLSEFGAGELDSCTVSAGVCGTMTFFPDPAVFGGTGDEDVVGFAADGSPGALYYFADQAFLAAGSYSTVIFADGQAATLVVTEVGATGGTVPEPGTVLLLSLGLAGIAVSRRPGTGASNCRVSA